MPRIPVTLATRATAPTGGVTLGPGVDQSPPANQTPNAARDRKTTLIATETGKLR
jgi:hypothetical protein